jgi:glycosyltransferase involved in cell wall biosynthesis
LVEKKAPELTIRACADVLAHFPEVRLDIIGDGPLAETCSRLIRELGAGERIRLVGVQSSDYVAKAMRQGSIFVQHSITSTNGDTEGMPVAIIEAMASGLPVVATRHSGIPEAVIDRETGILVDEGDVLGMTEAIAGLLSDPSRAKAMGEAGRQRVLAHFTQAQMRDRLRKILGLSTVAPLPNQTKTHLHLSQGADAVRELSSHDATEIDRRKWHQPLCTVIITHRNYTNHIKPALLSLLDQTNENWECIIVDDHSTKEERFRLREIVDSISHEKIRVIWNKEKSGQIATFYTGLDQSVGEFVSPLDPDDRLAPTYLQEMVDAHLNDTVFCPVVACDLMLLDLRGFLLTGTWKGRWDKSTKLEFDHRDKDPRMLFFSSFAKHWLWASTSALMIRRSAANLLTPHKQLPYNSLDSYLVQGCHFLGGTIFIQKPLVYRGLHTGNEAIRSSIFSMAQIKTRQGYAIKGPQTKCDALEALFHNGVSSFFNEKYLKRVLRVHFTEEHMALISRSCPEAYRIWRSTHNVLNGTTEKTAQVVRRSFRRLSFRGLAQLLGARWRGLGRPINEAPSCRQGARQAP